MALAVALSTPTGANAQQQSIPNRRPEVQDTGDVRRLIEEATGNAMSQAEIIDRLRQSGMTRFQARSRLQQMGYSPGLVDQYFDLIERGGEPPEGTADDQFLKALRDIGVVVDTVIPGPVPGDGAMVDALGVDPWLSYDPFAEPDTIEVFGAALFRRPITHFTPMLTGPVDRGYRLGPGDEVTLILTGDVELAYTLPVNREGFFVIPSVGQVFVNGLTLAELEDRLYDRLGRVYSGVRRDGNATTRFQVSLGRLRVNQIFVIGEVNRPNAYQVSAAASVLHALYLAGGPNLRGSFRQIQVRRGGKVVQTVDLYDYLLNGDAQSDIRLEHGDIVFVPEYERRVTVNGAVRRPAIYELLEGEDLRDAIRAAGGFKAAASVRRIQVDRILGPDERRPGVERVLHDIDLAEFADDRGVELAVRDGDVVQVFAVSDERRNRVVITGPVRKPGIYEWREGLTLEDLIERAEGLEEHAYTARAHIYRLNEVDGSHRLLRAHLRDDAGGGIGDVVLADRDSIVIFDRQELRNPDFATITGYVKHPGTYPIAEGMTVRDLILAAGGFIEGADTHLVEVGRLPDPSIRKDTTAIVIYVPIAPETRDDEVFKAAAADPDAALARRDVPDWMPGPEEFVLVHGDNVFVRRAPGYEQPRSVQVTGEVHYPGTFILTNRQERVLSILQRAGGLTEEANVEGIRLYRRGQLVAMDVHSVLRDPKSRYNIVLEPGDSLDVPVYDPTVLVTGAVTFESRILYEPGKGLDYYVNRSGGYADLADEGRVTVLYPDGERAVVTRRTFFFDSKPRIRPGSTIFVPTRSASNRGIDWGTVLTRTTAILSTLATVLIAVDRVSGS